MIRAIESSGLDKDIRTDDTFEWAGDWAWFDEFSLKGFGHFIVYWFNKMYWYFEC